MSRLYEMHVHIEGVTDNTKDTIIEACNDEWTFENWSSLKSKKSRPTAYRLEAHGTSSLSGGESESEFARRLKRAVWKALGTYVKMTIYATYLEDFPCTAYESKEEEFKELTGGEDP